MPLSAAARRHLAPLGVVTAAAVLFALLLLLVRLQWASLESADHSAAAWLNHLVAVIGISRLLRGVHYVSGVLAGSALGITAFAFELSRHAAGVPVSQPVTEGFEHAGHDRAGPHVPG
jgi:membrane-associated phospholipid phosphatase